MDEQALKAAVAEVLEVGADALSDNVELENFAAYDSTGKLSLMVCLSDFTPRPLSLVELQQLRTFGDIVALVKNGNG